MLVLCGGMEAYIKVQRSLGLKSEGHWQHSKQPLLPAVSHLLQLLKQRSRLQASAVSEVDIGGS